jgi:hypothetical protein
MPRRSGARRHRAHLDVNTVVLGLAVALMQLEGPSIFKEVTSQPPVVSGGQVSGAEEPIMQVI